MLYSNDTYFCCMNHTIYGYTIFKVYSIRPIDPVNINPIAREYIEMSNIKNMYVQVLVKIDDKMEWFMATPHQIRNCRMEIVNE